MLIYRADWRFVSSYKVEYSLYFTIDANLLEDKNTFEKKLGNRKIWRGLH